MSASKMLRSSPYSDAPLDENEIARGATLLLRAVKNDQGGEILTLIENAPNAKPYQAPARFVINRSTQVHGRDPDGPAPSSMTDAAKRRHDSDDDASSHWTKVSNPDDIKPPYDFAAKEVFDTPWTQHDLLTQSVMFDAKEDVNIPKPTDVANLRAWGQCLCQCDKYKEAKLSYFEMIEMAKSDPEMRQYLQYIYGRYGWKAGVTSSTEKITPGKDLARFLQRYGWNAHQANETTFTRQMKGK